MNNIKLEFSENELNAIINFINIGVKTNGLQVAESALFLVKKIQTFIDEHKKEEIKNNLPKEENIQKAG